MPSSSALPRPPLHDVLAVAPGLAKYLEGPIAELWKRPELPPRDRSIVTLAALIARNQTIDMPTYLNLALDNGVRPREISEIITHLAFYSGLSNAISAVTVAKDVFTQRKIGADQLPAATPRPLPLDEAAEADRAARVGQQFGTVAPGLVQYTTDVLFRDLWLRLGLAPRDRSLVTVSALIASGQVAQVPHHLNRAMDKGLTQAQAAEVITHLAFYIGWPNAMSALPVAKDVFQKTGWPTWLAAQSIDARRRHRKAQSLIQGCRNLLPRPKSIGAERRGVGDAFVLSELRRVTRLARRP